MEKFVMSASNFQVGQIQNSRSLTHTLVESLKAQITEGNLQPGTKLPSSKMLEEQAGVSRSVVREAVAALKAEGLVISKHGVGTFIANPIAKQSFSIEQEEFNSIEDAVQILELRMAVELEMTVMAARNRTAAQMAAVWKALEAFNQQLASGSDAVKEDLAFHLSIANASGNPYFSRFIKYIGEGVIPAREIVTTIGQKYNTAEYLEILKGEHHAIAQAIEDKDSAGARNATLSHLGNSRDRHLDIVNNYKK
jgi:DNA-binding FadR family transcriptional regulator